MAYSVEFSPGARRDVDEIVDFIAQDSLATAICWRDRLQEKVVALITFPHRCVLAPEDEQRPFEIRQAVFGNYRILFTVREEVNLVYIFTVRHAAHRFLSAPELDTLVS